MKYIYLLILILVQTNCSTVQKEDKQHQHLEHNEKQKHHQEEQEIIFTKAQAHATGITLDTLKEIKTAGYISSTGVLGIAPDAHASIHAKIDGVLTNSKGIIEGQLLRKGTIIAYLKSPKLIDLQQEFLELKAAAIFLKQQQKRVQTLYNTGAGVLQELEKTRADTQGVEAKIAGVSKHLRYLGIMPNNISIENITDKIPIKAPITGYITALHFTNGWYVTTNTSLLQMVDDSHMHLELDVFQKDIALLKQNQKVSYSVATDKNTVYPAKIAVIGKEIHAQTKTIRVHAHVVANNRPSFIKDLYLSAKIWLDANLEKAVAKQAIVQQKQAHFIFVTNNTLGQKELHFKKIRVKPGSSSGNLQAISFIDPLPKDAKIVTQGAYYIANAGNTDALEHSH